jgi:hypothetical protein
MKEKDFEDLVINTRLSKTSRAAARLVFVDGMSQIDAGAIHDLSPQRMNAIVATVRRAEQKCQPSVAVSGNELVVMVEASYAFAVKTARDELGDQVRIGAPVENSRTIGAIIGRTDFHLVQSVGRNSVMIHDLAKLNRVLPIGKTVAIQYENGHGVVEERTRQQQVQSR